jgi:hypothetical protein
MSTPVTMVWKAEISRSGKPCLWEKGGGATNTGKAQIITMPDGSKPFPLYVKGRGHLAGGEHALIAVEPGMYVILADHHRLDFVIDIFKVTKIKRKTEEVHGELVNNFQQNWWKTPFDEKFEAAVRAAQSKANDYHCRVPHYIIRLDNPFSAETPDYWAHEALRLAEVAQNQTTEAQRKFYLNESASSAEKVLKKLSNGESLQDSNRLSIEACIARLQRVRRWLVEINCPRIFFHGFLQDSFLEIESLYELQLNDA